MSKLADGSHNLAERESKKADWYTPQYLLSAPRAYFGGTIPLDPCTSADNPTAAKRFYTKETNGLERDWSRHDGVFVNPPYGKKFGFHAFIEKIHLEAEKGLPIWALLPCGARFSTKYWQEHILNEYVDAVCFIDHRVSFEDPPGTPHKGNLYDSIYYGLNVDPVRFAEAAWNLGRCFRWDLL
jgi:phage N-6-adenine-methyltransferase